ncbi:MAG: M23 family metallopeptidase [Deltaproteobacteria bacterium]|nr:M23 family metallopeptidase [Deltaproteobacteria bacterium]
MFKDYHIIVVPKDKSKTKTFKISALTLKVLLFTLILAVPLFFVAVFSTIHYQNKLIALKRNTYENQKLVENRKELIVKLSKLEKIIGVMDDSIAHLSELMDIDPQSLKFGTGPIDELDLSIFQDEFADIHVPEAGELVEQWTSENGQLTVNKFNQKFTRLNDQTRLLNRKLEEVFAQNKEKIHYVSATPSIMPVEGWITSEFGMRKHPIGRNFKMHNGLDIASPMGTPVKAPAGGKVIFSGRSSGYGKMLVIEHGYGISTMYAHLSELYVKKGETVKRGEHVGDVGTTGFSTGPHLHYEVRVDGLPKDPLVFLTN